MKKSILLILLLTITFAIESKTLKGKIVKVSDGDTVILLDSDNTQHKIRLDGIDAPEKGQAYGNKATDYLANLIAGKKVKVEYQKIDQYRRILGTIYYDEMNINNEMVRAGYAWRYYYNKNKHLLELQNEAKGAKRGLWKDKSAIDPYQYRKNKKNRSSVNKLE